jgi:MGT family glycosyltransferase
VNGLQKVYKTVLRAVEQLPEIQVVLTVGQNVKPQCLGTIPSNVIVVPAAPQIELLKRAALCITHAGLNTALESLAQGVPMVAIPIGYDQPGVAARIAHHGVGEFVEIEDLTVEGVRELIEKVLKQSGLSREGSLVPEGDCRDSRARPSRRGNRTCVQMRVKARSMAEIERNPRGNYAIHW